MANRPDRDFSLVALLAIYALVTGITAILDSIYSGSSFTFVGSALPHAPALVCHSVFLCCRPANRCPAIAAAVLSDLTCLGLFACLALTRTTWMSHLLANDGDYGDDDPFGDDDVFGDDYDV